MDKEAKKKMDNKIRKALKFISTAEHPEEVIRSRYWLDYPEKGKSSDFRDVIPKKLEEYLIKNELMSWDKEKRDYEPYLITKQGNIVRGKLEDKELKEITIKVAIVAAILLLLNLLNALWGLKNIWNAVW